MWEKVRDDFPHGQLKSPFDERPALMAFGNRQRFRREDKSLAAHRVQPGQAGGEGIAGVFPQSHQRRMAGPRGTAHPRRSTLRAGTGRSAGARWRIARRRPTGATHAGGGRLVAHPQRTTARHAATHRPSGDGAVPRWPLGRAATLTISRSRSADHRDPAPIPLLGLRSVRGGDQRPNEHSQHREVVDERATKRHDGVSCMGPACGPGGGVMLVVHRRPWIPGMSVAPARYAHDGLGKPAGGAGCANRVPAAGTAAVLGGWGSAWRQSVSPAETAHG